MSPELQALIEQRYANQPFEAAALARLIEAFQPTDEASKAEFLLAVQDAMTLVPHAGQH